MPTWAWVLLLLGWLYAAVATVVLVESTKKIATLASLLTAAGPLAALALAAGGSKPNLPLGAVDPPYRFQDGDR